MARAKKKVTYYMAGEYGTQHRRPHFHACLFGWTPEDKAYWRTTGSKAKLYTSEQLNKIWSHGFTSVGDVTFESAAYIARYIMDKQTGPQAWQYYQHVDEATGEIHDLKPEYNKMSLGKNNAIGKSWLDKYSSDVYPEGQILVRQHKSLSPKYYDKQFKKEDPTNYELMKQTRELQALEYRDDNTLQRLQAKERVTLAKINQLIRRI